MKIGHVGKTLRDRRIVLSVLEKSGPVDAPPLRLDLAMASREHFTRAGSPSQIGDERGNTDTSRLNSIIRTHEFESNEVHLNLRQSVAAPATVSGEP
jgi:hypothetical protein